MQVLPLPTVTIYHVCRPVRKDLIAIFIIFAFFLQGCEEKIARPSNEEAQSTQAETPTEVEVSTNETAPELARKYSESIFTLEVSKSDGDLVGTGTCFVAVNPSWVWTNFHVLKDGAVLKARTKSGAYFNIAKVLASDQDRDIAVLEIQSTGLSPCPIASAWPKQGSQCVVIGSPLGLDSQVSTGVVSSILEKGEIKSISFSAPISPGSSGSPLFDGQGNVIGICSQSLKHGQNLNIAIAWPEMLAIANRIFDEGSVVNEGKIDLESLFKDLTSQEYQGSPPVEQLALLDRFISDYPKYEPAIIEKSTILGSLSMFREQSQFLASKIAEGVETPKLYQLYSESLVSISRENKSALNGANIAPAEDALALDSGNVENWIFLAEAHRSNANRSEENATLQRALRAFSPASGQFTVEDLLVKAKILNKLYSFQSFSSIRSFRSTPEEIAAVEKLKIEYLTDELDCYQKAERLGHSFSLDDPPFLCRWWLGRSLWDNKRGGEAVKICEVNTIQILEKTIPNMKEPYIWAGDRHRILVAGTEDVALWKIALNRQSDIKLEVDALLKLAEFKHEQSKMREPLCLDFGWIFVVMLANEDWERASKLLMPGPGTILPDDKETVSFYKGIYHLCKGERDLFQSELSNISEGSYGRAVRDFFTSYAELSSIDERRDFLIDRALEWNREELEEGY
jgi:S1-C subfamily serine protease